MADSRGILDIEGAEVGPVAFGAKIDICFQRTGIPAEQVAGIGHDRHCVPLGEPLQPVPDLIIRDVRPGTPPLSLHGIKVRFLVGVQRIEDGGIEQCPVKA